MGERILVQMAVTLQRVDRVALITLNVPEKLNAMTQALATDFAKVLRVLQDDPSPYGCVVVTGAGRAFSAGGDLKWLEQRGRDSPSRNSAIMYDFYNKFLAIRSLHLPVVCAINGAAIGAGLCFAMACDIRIAAAQAKLGFTFVGLGLHPGMGATHFLSLVAGSEVAFRLLTSGEIISASEARELRIVSEVAENAQAALDRALALAHRIASQSPVAVRAVTRSLRQKQEIGLDQALWREADAQSYGYGSADFAEGLAAVAGKRKPAFKQYEQYVDSKL